MAREPNKTLASTALREWREESGTTYRELARATGLSVRTVLRAAAGQSISADAARRIAKRIGVRVSAGDR